MNINNPKDLDEFLRECPEIHSVSLTSPRGVNVSTDDLQQQLATANATIEQKEAELKILRPRLRIAAESDTETAAENQRLLETIEQQKVEIKMLKLDAMLCRKEIAERKERNEDLTAAKDHWCAEFQAAKKEVEALRERAAKQQSDINEIVDKASKERYELRAKIASLEASLKAKGEMAERMAVALRNIPCYQHAAERSCPSCVERKDLLTEFDAGKGG